MQVYLLISVTGLVFLCIGKNMISQATTVRWAKPYNEVKEAAATTDQYFTSNSSVKFNRLNRVKAKWSGNDIWESQARHSTNYSMSAYSTTSTSPPKRGSFPKSKRRKGSQSGGTETSNGRLPTKRIPAKIKKSGQLHRRTRPISPKKGSVTTTTTTPVMTTKIYTTTTTRTTTTTKSPPKRFGFEGNTYGNVNIKGNAKVKSASMSLDTGSTSKSKYKRKPSRPMIRVTVTDQPIRNETEMTTVVSSTSTTTATTPKTTTTTTKTTTTTTTKTPHSSSSPTKIVNLPSHLTKRPILPSRTITKKTTTSTPAPALSTTTHKYYPKTSNTLLSLLSASTTPAVTIPNTPFLFMEDNSFLTRLSISLFYSSIAIAPVIFTLFSGLAATKRKRKKRDLLNLSPLHSSTDLPYSFQNHLNPFNYTHNNKHLPPYHKHLHYEHRHKSLPHFLAEILKEIESTSHTKNIAR